MQITLQIYKFAPILAIKTEFLAFTKQKTYVYTTRNNSCSHCCSRIFRLGVVADIHIQGPPYTVRDFDKPNDAEDGYQVCRSGDSRGYGSQRLRLGQHLLGQLRWLRHRPLRGTKIGGKSMETNQTGVWLCRNCNTLLSTETNLCPKCGTERGEECENSEQQEAIIAEDYANSSEVKKNKYVIKNNGRHRCALLKAHYLKELSK